MSRHGKWFWKRSLAAALIPWSLLMLKAIEIYEFEGVSDFAVTAFEQYLLSLVPGITLVIAWVVIGGWISDFWFWLLCRLGLR